MASIDEIVHELHEHRADEPDRQFNAAISLGKIHDAATRPRVVAELVSALTLKHQALTRAHAAEALGDLAEVAAIPPLIASLKDPYRLVRSYAARALGKMQDAEVAKAIEPLINQLVKDDFFGARAEAAEALGNIAKLCEEKHYCESALLEKARAAVERDDLANLKQTDDRIKRMVNEMNRSIERLSKPSRKLTEDEKRGYEHANELRKGLIKLV